MSDMEKAIAFGQKMGKDLGKIYSPIGKEGFTGMEAEISLGNKMAAGFKRNALGEI